MQFTFETRFNSRGLAGASPDSPPKDAQLSISLKEFGDDRNLVIKFNSSGILTMTGFERLSGRPSVFVYGYVQEVSETEVIASPYVIGDLLIASEEGFRIRWRDACRARPESINIFSKVEFNQKIPKSALKDLQSIPEQRFKTLVADALGMSSPPKDWGGESCDIFMLNVLCDGERLDSAWMLKGPAKFGPLQPSGCGKNGDQVVRLFDNPADLFVVQHCHEVTPAVVKTLYAFAREPSRVGVKFCVIDGYDTWKIYKHFGVLS